MPSEVIIVVQMHPEDVVRLQSGGTHSSRDQFASRVARHLRMEHFPAVPDFTSAAVFEDLIPPGNPVRSYGPVTGILDPGKVLDDDGTVLLAGRWDIQNIAYNQKRGYIRRVEGSASERMEILRWAAKHVAQATYSEFRIGRALRKEDFLRFETL